MSMDHTNRRILDLLQQDARMSYADLARCVDRAESTVRERVAAMERRGIIRGYQARIDPALVGLQAHAQVRASFPFDRIREIERGLVAIPEVHRAQITTGPRPLLIELSARDLEHLERVLEERVSALGLADVSVDVLVRELVPPRAYRVSPASWVRAQLNDPLRGLVRPDGPSTMEPAQGNGRSAILQPAT